MTAFEPGTFGRASGGAIDGPGTSTSDEAGLFRLSKGEHVLDAGDVQKMGGQQAVYKFRAGLNAGMFEGRAAGGAIGGMVPSVRIANLDLRSAGGGGTSRTENNLNVRIDAAPGLAHEYASVVAEKAQTRLQDALHSSGIRAGSI